MFNIGDKLTKENYTRGAIWCNANDCVINPETWVIEEPAKPTEKEIAQKRIEELESYLSQTDWYAIRFSETGEAIPSEISEARASARVEISELREV